MQQIPVPSNSVLPHSSQAPLCPCKRGLDIFLSLIVILFISPFISLLFLYIKLTSKGPLFYSSTRIGKDGVPFTFWKIRSMHTDAEQRLDAVLQNHPELKREWETYFKLKKDPRVTRLGRWLRSTSIDEIPQLWNVLKGELSIVGPRPYLPQELDQITKILGERTSELFSVQPGLTGLWQTSGRNELSFTERVLLESTYAKHRSFFNDLKLIGKTIPVLLLRKGAF